MCSRGFEFHGPFFSSIGWTDRVRISVQASLQLIKMPEHARICLRPRGRRRISSRLVHHGLDGHETIGHIQFQMPRPSVKEQLIEAAVDTLHRQGFNGTGVQDITDAAGVPKGSFYNHFDSKEALGVESLDRYWQKTLRSLTVLSDSKLPPIERLKIYFRSLDEISRKRKYLRGCMIGNMATEMADQSAPIRERLGVILAAWSRAIESCVKEGQADGSIRQDIDSKSIASFLLNAWEGAAMRAKVDKDRTALRAFENVVFTMLSS